MSHLKLINDYKELIYGGTNLTDPWVAYDNTSVYYNIEDASITYNYDILLTCNITNANQTLPIDSLIASILVDDVPYTNTQQVIFSTLGVHKVAIELVNNTYDSEEVLFEDLDFITGIEINCFSADNLIGELSNLDTLILTNNVHSLSSISGTYKSLESLVLPYTVINGGTLIYIKCLNLKTLTVQPGSAKCFLNLAECTSLSNLNISEGVRVLNIALPKYLTMLELPSTAKEITLNTLEYLHKLTIGGEGAINYCLFEGTTSELRLRELVIREGTTKIIGTSNVFQCPKLETVILPSTLVELPVMSGMKTEHLTLPNITSALQYALAGGSLKSLTIPGSLKVVPQGFVVANTLLEELIIEEGVEIIELTAFTNTAIKKLILPNSLKLFDLSGLFIANVEEIYFPRETKLIINGLLSNSMVALKKLVLPYTYHDSMPFLAWFPNIEELDCNVKSISNCAYTKLKKVTLGPDVETIEAGAFANTPLTTINFPESLTKIKLSAFINTKLTYVILDNNIDLTEAANCFTGSPITGVYINTNLLPLSTMFAQCPIDILNIGSNVITLPSIFGSTVTTVKNITLPNSITEIKATTFSGFSNLESIVLPENLTEIPDYCFYQCHKLKSCNLTNIKTIGNYAFYQCDSLDSLNSQATLVKNSAFYGCTGLKSVSLLNISLGTMLGSDVFKDCTSLTSVNLPKLLDIPNALFSGCASLKEYNFENVYTIGENSFAYTGFASVNLPKITNLGSGAFLHCHKLTEVLLSTHIKVIPLYAFRDTAITTFTTPEQIVHIDSEAFAQCVNLLDIYLPEGIYYLGNYVFLGDASLTTITLPPNLLFIGRGLFEGVDLNTVSIGNMVQHILTEAFKDSKINTLVIPNSVTLIDEDAFTGAQIDNLTLSGGTITLFENALKGLVAKNLIFGEGIKHLRAYGPSNFETVTIPSTIKYIHPRYFLGIVCQELDIINTSTYTTNYPWGAIISDRFDSHGLCIIDNEIVNCKQDVTDIQIPIGVTKIRSNAFENCTKLKSIIISSSVEEIGQEAFKNCTSLSTISFSDNSSLQIIDDYAFYNCTSLSSITIPKTIISIGLHIFDNTSLVELILLSQSTVRLRENTIANCALLQYIKLNNCIVTYGAINLCEQLNAIYGTKSTIMEYYSITNCSNISTIECGSDTTICKSLSDGYMSKLIYTDEFVKYTSSTSLNYSTSTLEHSYLNIRKVYSSNYVSLISTYTSLPELTTVVTGTGIYALSSTFKNAPKLSSVTIAEGPAYMCDTFSECTSLVECYLPNSATRLDKVFQKCSALRKLKINGSGVFYLSWIDSYLNNYASAYNLKELEFGPACTGISTSFGGSITWLLTKLVLGSGITELSAGACTKCPYLQELYIPASITSWEKGSGYYGRQFSGLKYLRYVYFEDGLEYLPREGFRESFLYVSPSLITISLPKSIKYVGGLPFLYAGVTNITFRGTKSDYFNSGLHTNTEWWNGGGNGTANVTTVHCTDGDLTLNTSTKKFE